MSWRHISLLLILFSCATAGAQTINLSDSLRHVLRNKPVPTAKLDSRNSFITGRSARVQGIKAGLSFRNTLTIGIGYNWLAKDFTEDIQMNGAQYKGEIKLRYIAPFLEYSFYKKGPWEATVPVQLGFGKSFMRIDALGKKKKFFEGNVALYELSMNVEYKILNLVGVGGGFGYRIMLQNNQDIDHQFSSPVYVLRVRLIFDEIYKKFK